MLILVGQAFLDHDGVSDSCRVNACDVPEKYLELKSEFEKSVGKIKEHHTMELQLRFKAQH